MEIVPEQGETKVYPNLSEREEIVTSEYISSHIGVTLSPEEIVTLLGKMGLPSTAAGESIKVQIPASRSGMLCR